MPSKFLVFILSALLAACGTQISFKQGGDSGSFSAADRECRAPGKQYEPCMQAQGWSVHKMSEMNFSPLVVPVLTDNRTPGVPSGATAATPAATAAPAPAKSNPPDPLSTYKVAAWGKWGGSPEGLRADTTACVNTLGPAHKPDPNSDLMTLALIHCLKDKGWQGVQGY